MALVEMKVDPSEVREIRIALQEIATLMRAQLLADGYLQQPAERVPSTEADISVVTSEQVWENLQNVRAAAKRVQEQISEEGENVTVIPSVGLLTTDSPSPVQKNWRSQGDGFNEEEEEARYQAILSQAGRRPKNSLHSITPLETPEAEKGPSPLPDSLQSRTSA